MALACAMSNYLWLLSVCYTQYSVISLDLQALQSDNCLKCIPFQTKIIIFLHNNWQKTIHTWFVTDFLLRFEYGDSPEKEESW